MHMKEFNILYFLSFPQSDKLVQLVTEPVSPLLTWLSESTLSPAQRRSAIAWGLLQVTVCMSLCVWVDVMAGASLLFLVHVSLYTC